MDADKQEKAAEAVLRRLVQTGKGEQSTANDTNGKYR